MHNLTYYECQILRHLNGEEIPGLQWGAAMGVAIEFLRGAGYITGYTDIRITAAGCEAISAFDINKGETS